MGLYHLFYQSQAQEPFDTLALLALLHQARVFNREHHFSGLLLHTPDGRFLQVLEGEETVVRALYYDYIVADARHHRCRVLGAGACAQRSFADWNMGFRIAAARAAGRRHALCAVAVCPAAPRAPRAHAAAPLFCGQPRAGVHWRFIKTC